MMLGFYKVFFTFCAVLVGLVFAVMGFWNLLLVDVVLVLVELVDVPDRVQRLVCEWGA
ncbi:hypothetical protein BL5915_03660 [Bifidobacterium longum subsp. longum]|uniref:Uncharacterized protein n=1 Tax=Bifidobacterium longum subsp. longum TaxID=1679 RepID=A0A7L9UNR2_BIFLL|nr:hypothetical protein [Bifidobacterium longum]QOL56350.1 hypothetical protein BL5915_03660 [Bifidobacterium longum subsp. longum]